MNQKLSDWASVAEIVSGLAVVATLVFLILGIRENTDVTRASVYFGLIDSINESDLTTYSDPELSRIRMALVDGQTEELSELDMFRLRGTIVTSVRNTEKAYFAWEYGLLGDAEWQRMIGSICRNQDRAMLLGMSLVELNVLTQEFRDFISRTCD